MTIEAPETKIVDSYRVACDGSEGALGHPRVYLQIPEDEGFVVCPYCDCKFVHRDARANHA
ncbi:zinc-finger domain-containing protein [Phaeobacter sp. C3_T13_0]|uniref:zinc-finger domain-containing protein n=1 Tax=Phaeobacter cretensis TaxID=3342641 RepID=UPI0039BD084C